MSPHCLIERHLYFLDPGALIPRQGKWCVIKHIFCCILLINTLQNWICKSKEPFLNPAFIDVLKSSFFHRPTSVGYQILDKCMSSVKGLTEPELPMAMVALGATGVRDVISYISVYWWFVGICCALWVEEWVSNFSQVWREYFRINLQDSSPNSWKNEDPETQSVSCNHVKAL